MHPQTTILDSVPRSGRYLGFDLRPGATPDAALAALSELEVGSRLVVGIGEPFALHAGAAIDGLRAFPAWSGPGVHVPSTQRAVWCWLRGDDRGDLVLRGNTVVRLLDETCTLDERVDGFKYGAGELGLDLTGYEDGTENPTDDDAVRAAFVPEGHALAGSSFVAVQQWVHDLDRFGAFSPEQQDHIIGRRRSDNSEIDDAPESAHVKRTEQESFEPPAFVVRRSMPFSEPTGDGLMFVAFGATLDAFEVQLHRMVGLSDGVTDGLFRFSRPVTGGYYWCPPIVDGGLDLSAVAI